MDIFCRISPEYTAAGYKHICSGVQDLRKVVKADTAIHFDIDVPSCFRQHFPEITNLIRHRLDVRLTAKARVYAHQKDHIGLIQHIIQNGKRGCRIQGHTCFFSKGTDMLKGPVKMGTGLCVYGDDIGTAV